MLVHVAKNIELLSASMLGFLRPFEIYFERISFISKS